MCKTWSILYATEDQPFPNFFLCLSSNSFFKEIERNQRDPACLQITLSTPLLSLSLSPSFSGDMGRAPCCDKANVKRGPWSPEEDETLRNYIEKHGSGGNWIALPKKAGSYVAIGFSFSLLSLKLNQYQSFLLA